MFCPTCGAQTVTSDQKFCKSCGTNLTVVSQVLSAGPPLPPGMPGSMVTPNPLMAAPPPAAPHMSSIPPVQFGPQVTAVNPIPLSAIPELPYMQMEAKRQRWFKIGLLMTIGGPLFIPASAIFFGVLFNTPELCVFGIPILLLGVFLLLYSRIALKAPEIPQVIFVQSPSGQQPVLTQGQPTPAAQGQLPPPSVNSYVPGGYLSGTLTEQTTNRLEMPYQPTSRDTR